MENFPQEVTEGIANAYQIEFNYGDKVTHAHHQLDPSKIITVEGEPEGGEEEEEGTTEEEATKTEEHAIEELGAGAATTEGPEESVVTFEAKT